MARRPFRTLFLGAAVIAALVLAAAVLRPLLSGLILTAADILIALALVVALYVTLRKARLLPVKLRFVRDVKREGGAATPPSQAPPPKSAPQPAESVPAPPKRDPAAEIEAELADIKRRLGKS